MENTINHDKLGTCKILLNVELKDGKVFKFIRSWNYKKEDFIWNKKLGRLENRKEWINSRTEQKNNRPPRPHYYALWGNSHNIEDMGITKLTKKGGSNVKSQSSAYKKFHDLIISSKNMTFQK